MFSFVLFVWHYQSTVINSTIVGIIHFASNTGKSWCRLPRGALWCNDWSYTNLFQLAFNLWLGNRDGTQPAFSLWLGNSDADIDSKNVSGWIQVQIGKKVTICPNSRYFAWYLLSLLRTFNTLMTLYVESRVAAMGQGLVWVGTGAHAPPQCSIGQDFFI